MKMRYGKMTAVLLVAGLCLASSILPAEAGCLKCKVKGYLKAHIDRDLDRALSYFTDDCTLRLSDTGLSFDREGIEGMLGWQFATGTRMMYDEIEWQGQTVTAVFRVTNDYYPIFGVKNRKYRMTFTFEGDRIREQVVEAVPCGCKPLEELMSPFLEWAGRTHGEELERIYPGGRFVYEEDAGRSWMSLLEQWRAEG